MNACKCFHVCTILAIIAVAAAQGRAAADSKITYQGQISLNGDLVNQPCDFTFSLWSADVGGSPIGPAIPAPGVPVERGVFTVQLDFGAGNLQTSPLWLQVSANCTGSPITLTPRQPITAAPLALHTQGINVDANGNATVAGVIQSTVGGFKFPDNTTMASKNDVVTGVTAGAGLSGGGTAGVVSLSVDNSTIITGVTAGSGLTGGGSGGDVTLSVDNSTIITGVTAGSGLTGGGSGGDVTLNVSFAGTGSATTVSRSDHRHSQLAASDGTPAAALVVDAAGKVGIGVTSPGAFLDVDAGATVSPPGFRVSQTDNHFLMVGTGATFAGGIGVNSVLTTQGSMNFQKRTTAGVFDANSFNIMSLFFSDNHLEVYGNAIKPGGGSWGSPSDRKLKKNIQPLGNALNRLLELRGVSFEYIETSSPLMPSGKHTGFVAQDVEKVFPEWVSDSSGGYKAVTVSGFEALTVESLRQLRQEKDAEIAALQQRIEKLERLVNQSASNKAGGQ